MITVTARQDGSIVIEQRRDDGAPLSTTMTFPMSAEDAATLLTALTPAIMQAFRNRAAYLRTLADGGEEQAASQRAEADKLDAQADALGGATA